MNRLVIAFTLALTASVAAPVLAQEAETEEASPEESRETSFQNVTGPQVEDVPGGALMIGAYGVAWFVLIGYVLRLAMLNRRTALEVDALHHAIRNATERND
ncbi:MAG: hypothetical protein JJ863_04235 [Deltaproteobacteria bacterium]|nr:hypothetical protein [Deltaproteobacteria bacterium]